jgi:hypothetical protein
LGKAETEAGRIKHLALVGGGVEINADTATIAPEGWNVAWEDPKVRLWKASMAIEQNVGRLTTVHNLKIFDLETVSAQCTQRAALSWLCRCS